MKPENRVIYLFIQEVISFNRNYFCKKFPDAERTGNKPFDVILDSGRRISFLEFKQLPSNRKSFSPKTIFKPHQIRELNRIAFLHQHASTPNAAWAIIKRGPHYFIVHPSELLKEKLTFTDFDIYSIRELVRALCER